MHKSKSKSPPYLKRFLFIHAIVLTSLFFSPSRFAIYSFFLMTFFRVIGVSISYHRYFSHRSFETTRIFQFILAIWGSLTAQRDPLWWASTHRYHHKYSDQIKDPHSPIQKSFWYSHIGWVCEKESMVTRMKYVNDFKKYPELFFLNGHPYLIFFISLLLTGLLGFFLRVNIPRLETGPIELIFWSGLNSFIACAHITFGLNSLNHRYGKKEFPTKDYSTNIWWLFPFLLGENWHNNHHFFPNSASTWVKWYQIDFIYIIIKSFEKLHLVWDVKTFSNHSNRN